MPIDRGRPHLDCRNRPHQRPGFTLLELVLVLAIVVMAGAVAWPRIAHRAGEAQLRDAALELKASLADARASAIESGQPWACLVLPSTGHYETGPRALFRSDTAPPLADPPLTASPLTASPPTASPLTASPPTAPPPTAPPPTAPPLADPAPQIERHELPADLRFTDPWAVNLPNSQPVAAPVAALLDASTRVDPAPITGAIPQWIVFEPSGRAAETEVKIEDQLSQNAIRLRVRGLTGGVTLSTIERPARTLPGSISSPDPSQSNHPSDVPAENSLPADRVQSYDRP